MKKVLRLTEPNKETEILFYNPSRETILVFKLNEYSYIYSIPSVKMGKRQTLLDHYHYVRRIINNVLEITGSDSPKLNDYKPIWVTMAGGGRTIKSTLLIEIDDSFSIDLLRTQRPNWELIHVGKFLESLVDTKKRPFAIRADYKMLFQKLRKFTQSADAAIVTNRLMEKLTNGTFVSKDRNFLDKLFGE